MPAISEAELVQNGGWEHPWPLPNVMAAELGPYSIGVTFKIRAYTRHVGGGDSSTAEMQLFYDGAQVGQASDHHFNTANLEVLYNLYLGAGNTADLRIRTDNSGATVDQYGFALWWQCS